MSKDRNCKMCVYYSENGCSQFNCQGTTTVDDIRADERTKVIEDVHKAMANKYHCKEDMCEVGMTCADCLKAYMEDLYSNK